MAFALSMVSLGQMAEAREKPRVAIAIVGCDEGLAREAQRIAAVELRAALVEGSSDATTTTDVAATCGVDSAQLRVVDPTTGKSLERSVALAQAAQSARARLLALAIAELVAASWAELVSNPEPQAPPAVPLASANAREAARAAIAPAPLDLEVLADVHVLASRDLLLGGGARTRFWLSPQSFLRADVLVHHAELSRASGTIAVTMTSVAGAAGMRFGSRLLRPDVSLGMRAGYAWMSGVAGGPAATGYRHEGAFVGPELALGLTAWAWSRVQPRLALSSGAHIVGIRGTVDGERDVAATALWAGISLGATLR